jgi:hypothetical protein
MKTQKNTALALISLLLANNTLAKKQEKTKTGVTKAQGPPPFFLQDPTDSLCLAGDEFKRCSIDTLFFVVGQPGKFIYILFMMIVDCCFFFAS